MTQREGTRRLLMVDADLRRSGMLVLHTAIAVVRTAGIRRTIWAVHCAQWSSGHSTPNDFRPWIVGLAKLSQ